MTAVISLFESKHSQSMHFIAESSILLKIEECRVPYIDILLHFSLPSGLYIDTFEISRWPGLPVDWRRVRVIENDDSIIHCERIANRSHGMQFALKLLSIPTSQHDRINEGSCPSDLSSIALYLNFTLPIHKQYHRITEEYNTHNTHLLAPFVFVKSTAATQQFGNLRERVVNSTLLELLIANSSRGIEANNACSEFMLGSYFAVPHHSQNISLNIAHMPTARHSDAEWVIASTIFVQLFAALVLSVLLITKL